MSSDGESSDDDERPDAPVERDPDVLLEAMLRRVSRATTASGEIVFPAIPGNVERYVDQLTGAFEALLRPIGEEDRTPLRDALLERLQEGFSASPHSKVTAKYWTVRNDPYAMTWELQTNIFSMADEYADWVQTRDPPLFGEHPDSRLMSIAAELGPPKTVTYLDVGAGTGRNTLPLARKGYLTDALEPVPALAEILEASLKSENLKASVVRGDFWDRTLRLPREHYKLILLSEVCSHFRGLTKIRDLFRRLSDVLEPNGIGLFNIFLSEPEYLADPIIREAAETLWCPVYSMEELEVASYGFPLELVSDEKAWEFEREHAPHWPPTSWYGGWAGGQDLFDLPLGAPPVKMHWLAYRRT